MYSVSGSTRDMTQHRAIDAAEEAALLINCLRGLPCVVPRDTDWKALLRLAEQNGVLPLFHRLLLDEGVEVPGFFTASAQESRTGAESFVAELESLLERFAERSIEVLPLKGPVLAEALYGDVTMRSCNDLDLLVRQDEYARAQELLSELGFAASEAADDYHRRFVRHGVPVELHFGIASPRYFPFDLDGVWSRSRAGNFRGRPIRLMSYDDMVLFLCLHGLKHGFSRLIWILDVGQALRSLSSHDSERLLQRARREGQEPWLLLGCEVVREMFPQMLPDAMDAAIAASPKVAGRAREAAAQLFAEGLEVVNDHKIRSFYLQIERSARKRWRCRMSYFAPTAEDERWTRRHGIHRNLMGALRPFRLLHKHGLSRVWRRLFPSAP